MLCLSLKPLQSELMDWWVLLRLRSGYVVEVLCGLIITSLSLFEGRVADGSIGVVEVAGASLYHHHILVCMSLASFSYTPLNQ